jgi:hypothetical protein
VIAPAKIGYGVAAACFVVALQKSSEPQWWEGHRVIGVLIGISIPLCVLAAWLAETPMHERSFGRIRFIPHRPEALAIAAWVGIGIGLLALAAFLFTVSGYLALGFLVGVFLLGQYIDMTTPPPNV